MRRRLTDEDWAAHPAGGGTPAERYLVEKRSQAWLLAVIEDEDRSYEYDEFALLQLGRHYYLLQTTGCSCPSPSETWTIQVGPTSLRKVREHILSGAYDGYDLPVKKRDAFIAALDEEQKRRVK